MKLSIKNCVQLHLYFAICVVGHRRDQMSDDIIGFVFCSVKYNGDNLAKLFYFSILRDYNVSYYIF